ncbi:thioredoxin domain-containing protein [Mesonia aestuariivivens]|uniref:Thioredoxin domain-containing protein n=1 Tax=Mesonia aestuariivivens TaxID=2796128 RepID=A0ABS6W3N4_9FLAO|nr:thioredoxin domain-containing protein [Mesonia aestuariivivens]MBW2962424.1 thioredoxin domain-containing protein [Mesonia aestuariivivens]
MRQLENLLSKETSPYLLQHAKNPVHWQPWSDSTLQFSKDNNKLLLISIGYSACHWCHVMEKECFEDQEVASLMNQNFINIKIDREERPDIDQIYMSALQIMTGHGGWPLNIVALPDGRPVWGATYLPKKKWMGSLNQLKDLYIKAPEHIEDYAEKLSTGMQQLNSIVKNDSSKQVFHKDQITSLVNSWKNKFDLTNGGFKSAPKFMMPNNLSFLLEYAVQQKNDEVLNFVEFSLLQMAQRGIYDQIGGGFSRYAVDEKWHIPHFEKMLYDNAQLVDLYSDAFTVFNHEKFKQVVGETLSFIENELTHQKGYFFSALDADSLNDNHEKEEGAFYRWTKEELQSILKDDFDVFSAFFNINTKGYWENNHYILFQTETEETIAHQFNISVKELKERIEQSKNKLFQHRQQRAYPSLDDKCITSWNALMIKAYAKAYRIFKKNSYLKTAEFATDFIIKNLFDDHHKLYRNFKKYKKNEACLEDYALFIAALIELYQANFKEELLVLAKKLTEKVIVDFYDEKSGLFFYTSKYVKLIQRSIETQDNVIPSSNSVMAKNFFFLGKYFLQKEWLTISKDMLKTIEPHIKDYPSNYSNWLSLYLKNVYPFYEVVITGEKAEQEIKELQSLHLANSIIARPSSKISLTEGKTSNTISFYICKENYCEAPLKNTNEVISKLKNEF